MQKTIMIILIVIMAAGNAIGLLNPAAVHCEKMGYYYHIKSTNIGDIGICVVDKDEDVHLSGWDFYIGQTGQEYSYCAKKGYEIKAIHDPEICKNTGSSRCAVCIVDGEQVTVQELMNLTFFEGPCGDGICRYPNNAVTCPQDCPQSGEDMYCQEIEDGICDPDCEKAITLPGKEALFDPDCASDDESPQKNDEDAKETDPKESHSEEDKLPAGNNATGDSNITGPLNRTKEGEDRQSNLKKEYLLMSIGILFLILLFIFMTRKRDR